MQASSLWARCLDKEAKLEDFEYALKNNIVSHAMRRYVKLRLQELLKLERLSEYDQSAWSHKQAHVNGSIKELYTLLTMLGETNPYAD